MKRLITLCILCLAAGFSFAQSTYESPCVEDGKTFQLTIPEGFTKVETPFSMRTVYTTLAEADFAREDIENLAVGSIVIYYEDRDGRTLDDRLKALQKDQEDHGADLDFTVQPKIVDVNDHKIIVSASKGNLRGTTVNALYTGIFMFGQQIVMVGYIATEKLSDFLPFDEFETIFSSLTEFESDKEEKPEDDFEEQIRRLMNEAGVERKLPEENDLFETKLSNYFIVPVSDDHWSTNWDKSSHLFDEYLFKEENGSVQIFSGGNLSDYKGKEQIEHAIQLVLDAEDKPSLTFKSKSSSEYYNFKQYDISGAGSIKLVYTAEIENELVFFLVDEGSNSVSGFTAAAQNLIMLVEFMSYDDPRIKTSPATPIEE